MFDGMDFLSGSVTFMESSLQEDMLQVEYLDNYLLDVGWYEETRDFVIYIIKDYEWTKPVAEYRTKNEADIRELVNRAIMQIETESARNM